MCRRLTKCLVRRNSIFFNIGFREQATVKSVRTGSNQHSAADGVNNSESALDTEFFGKNILSRTVIYLLVFLIKKKKKVISPWLRPCCRFTPSCSNYALLALRRHGVCKGVLLTVWRIVRCNPYCKGGIDEVPERGKWR